MIYLDHGATSFPKPAPVRKAVAWALGHCANPGRGGYEAALAAQNCVFFCREAAAKLFSCPVEQVVCTGSCTHGLNIAIRTLVKPGDKVLISGFEHNAVTRPLQALGAQTVVAGRRLFDWGNMLESWENALKAGVKVGIFTHVSNVFGYILPVEELGRLCQKYGVPYIIDAAQSAGHMPLDFSALGADFIAMPGHKGLLGPQGTGLLLCGRLPEPLICGGTGSNSQLQTMPDFLPDRAEAGTLNVPGLAGLNAGIRLVSSLKPERLHSYEVALADYCADRLTQLGCRVFTGPHRSGTLAFIPKGDCELVAQVLARRGIALRAGLQCAPLAHESAGTLDTGTLRLSLGYDSTREHADRFLQQFRKIQ